MALYWPLRSPRSLPCRPRHARSYTQWMRVSCGVARLAADFVTQRINARSSSRRKSCGRCTTIPFSAGPWPVLSLTGLLYCCYTHSKPARNPPPAHAQNPFGGCWSMLPSRAAHAPGVAVAFVRTVAQRTFAEGVCRVDRGKQGPCPPLVS
jgi:hypothetical protein